MHFVGELNSNHDHGLLHSIISKLFIWIENLMKRSIKESEQNYHSRKRNYQSMLLRIKIRKIGLLLVIGPRV